MAGPPRVLVVEDDRRVREALGTVVAAQGFEPVATGTARDALAALSEGDFALILADLGLPDMDGVTLIETIVRQRPEVPVLVLTVASAQSRIDAALRAGARGYLLKQDVGTRLGPALEMVLAGGMPLSRAAADAVLVRLRAGPEASVRPTTDGLLTPREREVLHGLAHNLTYAELASDLGVSINTVRAHVRAIYEKLGTSTRTEAVLHAIGLGLLDRA